MAECVSSQNPDEISHDDAARSNPQSVSIIVLGKTGSGKTSLASDIAGKPADGQFQDKAGWKPDTSGNRSVTIKLDDVELNVVDTRGMKSTNNNVEDEEILSIVERYYKERGVIIICIEMHDRIDESTMEILVQLDRKFERKIWKHVVIALTKADRYEEHKWLVEKKAAQTNTKFLTKKFEEVLQCQKESIKEYFTATPDQVSPSCCLNMSMEEFEMISNAIIPTSQLRDYEMRRMRYKVRQGHWFDQLILTCCKRICDGSILTINSKRLLKYHPEKAKELFDDEELQVEQLQENPLSKFTLGADRTLTRLGYTFGSVLRYHNQHAIDLPRFIKKGSAESCSYVYEHAGNASTSWLKRIFTRNTVIPYQPAEDAPVQEYYSQLSCD